MTTTHAPTTPGRRVRLIDIAREANVSRAAVGFVINKTGQGVISVSDETRQRILQVAQRLGYHPNRMAQSLAGKSSKIIGVIIDSSAMDKYQMLMHMERIASARGYRFMVGQSHESLKHVEAYSSDFASWGVDGVLCLSHDYPDFGSKIVKVLNQHRHVVYVDPPLLDPEKHCYVQIDMAAGMRQVMQRLVADGRRRIALLSSNSQYQSTIGCIRGYQQVMDEASLSTAGLHHNIGRPAQAGPVQKLMGDLLARKVDAIVATYDQAAVLATSVLLSLGRRVPEDVAICGWNNTELAQSVIPALSSVDVNSQAVAEAAIHMLMRMIADEPLSRQERQVTVNPFLVPRGSL